jgi:hypothetical protein
VKPTLKGDISLRDNEFPFDCHHPCQVEEETLARTIPADDKANARSSLLDPLEVIQYSGNFIEAANLEVVQSYPRDDSGAQRLKDCVPLPWFDGNAHERPPTR